MFTAEGQVLRQVNPAGLADYERLMSSGLYAALTAAGDLVPHHEVDPGLSPDGRAARVLRPQRIPFISYPYEWCFSQLQDAALLTLRVQQQAVRFGLSLKDATPYNVQFGDGRPMWIDTLSFERLEPGAPWVAYRQFCESFLAPLSLVAHTDARLQRLLRVFLDGVPVDLASRLLPGRTRLTVGLGVHIHLHAAAARRATSSNASRRTPRRLSAEALPALVQSLARAVRRLTWQPAGTVWGDYYRDTNYTPAAFDHKREIVRAAVTRLQPALVWDLGANDGTFSRVAAERGPSVLSFDLDPAAVEKNYLQVRQRGERGLLPLVMDLSNPSPACGWAGEERHSLAERGPADMVFALALVHHLAIGHNVPLERIAAFFAAIGRALLIEFVPKEDSQVQRMLATRADVFAEYSQSAFEHAFQEHFQTVERTPVRESARTLYLFTRRG